MSASLVHFLRDGIVLACVTTGLKMKGCAGCMSVMLYFNSTLNAVLC